MKAAKSFEIRKRQVWEAYQLVKANRGSAGIDQVTLDVLESIRSQTGVIPEKIRVDNGSEIISKALDKWAYDNQVILDFSDRENQQIMHILSLSMEASEVNI